MKTTTMHMVITKRNQHSNLINSTKTGTLSTMQCHRISSHLDMEDLPECLRITTMSATIQCNNNLHSKRKHTDTEVQVLRETTMVVQERSTTTTGTLRCKMHHSNNTKIQAVRKTLANTPNSKPLKNSSPKQHNKPTMTTVSALCLRLLRVRRYNENIRNGKSNANNATNRGKFDKVCINHSRKKHNSNHRSSSQDTQVHRE
mmetsp:Transcript_3604/g.6046  ORF Transcript_3604/g.6046 Transcript_3604/m.6046 type:complete len:202 (+) Transcript_3604:213-818(+)